jgi:acyl-CoA dehydrogenase
VELDQQAVAIEHKANVTGEPRDPVQLNGATAGTLRPAPSPVLVRARLGVLWSAAICGAVARAYEMTRRYVHEREQFGRPLVVIPAVASSSAMMRMHVLQTQAGLARAVECWETADTDPERCATRPPSPGSPRRSWRPMSPGWPISCTAPWASPGSTRSTG